MSNQFLALLEDIDGKEVLVSIYGSDEVKEFLELIEDSTFTFVNLQNVDMFLSLHDLRKIINDNGKSFI